MVSNLLANPAALVKSAELNNIWAGYMKTTAIVELNTRGIIPPWLSFNGIKLLFAKRSDCVCALVVKFNCFAETIVIYLYDS